MSSFHGRSQASRATSALTCLVSPLCHVSSPLDAGRQSRPSSEEPAQPHCTGRCAFVGSWASLHPSLTMTSSLVPLGPWHPHFPTWAPRQRGVKESCVDWCLNQAYHLGLPCHALFWTHKPPKCTTQPPSCCPGIVFLQPKSDDPSHEFIGPLIAGNVCSF